mgnify:CR=1 FL=1
MLCHRPLDGAFVTMAVSNLFGGFMNKSFLQRGLALSAPLLLWPGLAGAANIDGAVLSAWWGLPFAGILLSIALCPLLTPTLWHHHYGKIATGWALAFLAGFGAGFRAVTTLTDFFAGFFFLGMIVG